MALHLCVVLQAWVHEMLFPLETCSSGFRWLPGITVSTWVSFEAGYHEEASLGYSFIWAWDASDPRSCSFLSLWLLGKYLLSDNSESGTQLFYLLCLSTEEALSKCDCSEDIRSHIWINYVSSDCTVLCLQHCSMPNKEIRKEGVDLHGRGAVRALEFFLFLFWSCCYICRDLDRRAMSSSKRLWIMVIQVLGWCAVICRAGKEMT